MKFKLSIKTIFTIFSLFLLNSFASAQTEIKIGQQVWMTSNLNVNSFRDGVTISEAKNRLEWEQLNKESHKK